ncbi:MAG: amidohydrolase family protein [Myxococcota bacterium]|nr:amidohydrolase family protein [Myxococcota bacterium]
MCTCTQLAAPATVRSKGLRGAFEDAARRILLATRGAVPAPSDFTLDGVEVVNPGVSRLRNARVRVEGGRIASVEEGPETDRPPCHYVLPGLIDMHVHAPPPLADLFARLQLLHGVTTARYAAADDSIYDYRDALARGERSGPRVLTCGPLLDGSPRAFPVPVGASALATPADARRAVEDRARRGADFVKVFINLRPEVLAEIRSAATEYGLPIVGHVPRFARLETAGVADIQHLTGIPDQETTAFTSDGSFTPWLGAWRRTSGARIEQIADACGEQGIAHTPTLVMWKGLARCVDERIERPPTRGLLPEFFVEAFWAGVPPPTPYRLDRGVLHAAAAALPHMLEAVARLHEAGVPIHAGTDTINPWVVPGASLHEELRLLCDAGLGAEDALAAATTRAGDSLGVTGLGHVAAGAHADLLLLRDDPTRDLGALASLERVVCAGRAWDVDRLRDDNAHRVGWLDGTVARAVGRALGSALAVAGSRRAAMAPPPTPGSGPGPTPGA